MNFEVINQMVNSPNLPYSFLVVLFIMGIPMATVALTTSIKSCVRWTLIVLILIGGGTVWWSEYVVPDYQMKKKSWEQEQAKKAEKEKIANTPWTSVTYKTKVSSVDYRQILIFFETFEVVEFMDDKEYVYNRTYSMSEGYRNQVQASFHHQLLKLQESGEEILVTYKTKGAVDPSGKRIITKISKNNQAQPVWPVN